MAADRGVETFSAYCESHTSEIPFHVVAQLLRAALGVSGLDPRSARVQMRERFPDADADDLLLLDDLIGIADPDAELPRIDPDARRRRLTSLVNTASLSRESSALYIVEDAHWIDSVSESMLADFVTVMPQTPSVVVFTYRPEYRGALSRVTGAQTITLVPLTNSQSSELVSEILGGDPSVLDLTRQLSIVPPAIRSSPKNSYVISPSEVCYRATAVRTLARRKPQMWACPLPCRRRSPRASIASIRWRNARCALQRSSVPGLLVICWTD